jgi:hypothetical protein
LLGIQPAGKYLDPEVNGKVYIFGGTDGNTYLHDLWEFNPANNTWAQKASLPGVGRQQSQAFVLNSEVYVCGGTPMSGGALKEIWRYNPATNQWTRLPDFPGATGPAGGVGFAINGAGYVVCGNGTVECWEYTPYITGMQDLQPVRAITVFPNPSSKTIFVKMPAGVVCESVTIYNVSGIIMQNDMTVSNSDVSIDITKLASGFYILKVKTNSGTLLNGNFIKSGN